MTYEAIQIQLILLGYIKHKDLIGEFWVKNDVSIEILTVGFSGNNILIKIQDKNGLHHFHHLDILKDYLDGIKLTK